MIYSRLKIYLRKENPISNSIIFNDRYLIYSFILNAIRMKNPDLSDKIHSNKLPRAFVFSNIIPYKSYHILYFTTPYKEVFNAFYSGLNRSSRLNDRNKMFNFNIVNTILENFDISSYKHFNFLSPFLIRTKEKVLDEIDLNFFEKSISEGIKRVSTKLNIDVEDTNVKINGTKDDFRKKLYVFKNSKNEDVYIRAFSAKSPSVSISFNDDKAKAIALFYGIGDRTKLGFGMLGFKGGLGEGLQ
ncbi:MAG: CRISPR-associated endoribonuclease Cas6 [Candidatus Micrarchaeia archaeon]